MTKEEHEYLVILGFEKNILDGYILRLDNEDFLDYNQDTKTLYIGGVDSVTIGQCFSKQITDIKQIGEILKVLR